MLWLVWCSCFSFGNLQSTFLHKWYYKVGVKVQSRHQFHFPMINEFCGCCPMQCGTAVDGPHWLVQVNKWKVSWSGCICSSISWVDCYPYQDYEKQSSLCTFSDYFPSHQHWNTSNICHFSGQEDWKSKKLFHFLLRFVANLIHIGV